MKNKTIIFILSFALCLSFLVIPSFAAELNSEEFITGEWYFLEYNPDVDVQFPLSGSYKGGSSYLDILVIKKDGSRVIKCSSLDFNAPPSYLVINYRTYSEERGFYLNSETIYGSNYYYLVKYTFTPSDTVFLGSVFDIIDNPFSFSPAPYVTYRTSTRILDGLDGSVLGLGEGVLAFSDDIPFDFDGIFIDSVWGGSYFDDYDVPSLGFNLFNQDDPYLTVAMNRSSPFRVMFESDSIVDELGFFYYYFDVPLLDESYVPPKPFPVPPSDDVPDFFSISDFVVSFVVSVFNGLDNLVIYPGVSALNLFYAIVCIYFVRFFLKLVAGG